MFDIFYYTLHKQRVWLLNENATTALKISTKKSDDDRLSMKHEAWITIHFMNKLVLCKMESFPSNDSC
jgi:hypothetical protein